LPGAAAAHAYLIKTFPSASGLLARPPAQVELTYDEAVEPHFAIISVTNRRGVQEATAAPARSPSDPDTLFVPLKPRLPEGWYLVYWRAISVDGHPVQGAFTFAVGPHAGVAPQFAVPHISQTATTTPLLIARWAMFLGVMTAIGLFFMRSLVLRPVARRFGAQTLRPLALAYLAACCFGLLAIPAYLEEATAVDSLRSFDQVGALVPLFTVTAFGRGYVDLELCFALFVACGLVALWVDKPERESRSIAELVALLGAVLAAAACLEIPGAAGHAAQTAPRPLALALDWLHLVSASLWLGGLVGLLVIWRTLEASRRMAVLADCVPRFSRVAVVSVAVLLCSGVGATILHLPILAALWQTSYGQAILVKAALLAAAIALGATNLTRTSPRLQAFADSPERALGAARLLRRLVSGEAALVVAALFAAAVLSSLAPPPPALAEEGGALARVGPGRVAATVTELGYTLQVLISPNHAAAPNDFAVKITRGGVPLRGASVTLTFEMLDMQMGSEEYQLVETAPGLYSRPTPALVMVGHWGLSFAVVPRSGHAFSAVVVDYAAG
jgi:copper transport protein